MIELDEAIKHYREKAEALKNKGFEINTRFNADTKIGRKCYDWASQVEQIATLLTELKARREADRWILIDSEEDLPKESGKYLVSLDFGDVSIDYYDKDWGFVCYIGNVIAWKPMPKPCGESEAENENC